MESQSSSLSENSYVVEQIESEYVNFHLIDQRDSTLHDDTRWLNLVAKYAHAPVVNLGVFRSKECILLIRGNYFSKSRFGAKTLVVGGFLDYGNFLAIKPFEELSLNLIKSLATTKLKIHRIITKEIVDNSNALQSLAIINLKNISRDTYSASITSRARNDIRRAVASNVNIEFNHEHVHEFYELYCRRMHQFGTPPHPLSFFKEMISKFEENIYVGVAKIGDRVISASLGITINKSTYHLFASSDPNYKSNSPGDLLLYEEIMRSIDIGVEKFWLGRSLRGSGVEFYKSKWNPEYYETKEITWDVFGTNNQNDQSRKQNIVAKIFRNLPFPIFKLIGTRIRRFIP